jgi:hypothetical protein
MSHHRDVCDNCCRVTCICDRLHQEACDKQEFSETLKGRKALERWAKLQDESQGC